MTGAWPGKVSPFASPRSRSPPTSMRLQRKAEHFEILLGLLELFARPPDTGLDTFWRRRRHAAIQKAEAILAGARDPDAEGGVS